MRSMKKAILIFALVSLLFVGMLPVVEAPSFETPNWDVIYDVRNSYAEDEPGWTRDTGGTIVRAFQYHNQILNVSLTGATSDFDRYTREIPESDFLIAEARLNMPTTAGHVILVFNTSATVARLSVQSTHISLVITNPRGWTQTNNHYEENILGANHTYTLVTFKEDGNTYIQGYYDHNLILQDSIDSEPVYTHFWFEFEEVSPANVDKYCEWDYVAIRTTDLTSKIADLENEIDELKRELEKLKKQTGPDVVVNETNLPCIPRDTRGTLEYDTLFVDPYLVTVYDLLTFKTGSDLDFYLIYPSTSDEVTVIEDWIHIEETSYTRLIINDTVGGTELLNTTDAVGPFNLEYGYNITVQTSGASSSVRADRTSTVRLISAFEWGESTQTGIFGTTSKIENDLGFEDMSNVLIRWAFPTEDAYNRDVDIDMSSVTVWDEDNNIILDRGRHYSLDESSVIMELRWLNTSDSRTFRIEFVRESFVETEEYFVVRDNDVSIADTYPVSPFTTNIHFTASGRAFFEGKLIIRFDLTGRYAGEHIDVRSLIIKRSDQSGSSQFTYDSISNELRITDVTVDAGDSITFALYWDWYDEKSAVYELILGDPLILYSLLLLAGFAGLFIFLDATKEEKRRKYAGIIIIAVDVVILVIILVVS